MVGSQHLSFVGMFFAILAPLLEGSHVKVRRCSLAEVAGERLWPPLRMTVSLEGNPKKIRYWTALVILEEIVGSQFFCHSCGKVRTKVKLVGKGYSEPTIDISCLQSCDAEDPIVKLR